jgi:hypothetical protein
MEDVIKFKTSSPAGDLLSMLAGIQQLTKEIGKKAIIYQRLNMTGVGYNGAIHPFKNDIGDEVAMNEYMFHVMRPLLIEQDYIEDYIIYDGQEYNYDLDKARLEIFTNQPHGSINRWIFYVYPQMSCDLSKAWLDVPQSVGKIEKLIINFTYRYRNSVIDYSFLKKYQDYILFAGLKDEYEFFSNQWNLRIGHLDAPDFKKVAYFIKNSIGFLGNQSSCYQIAEGLKAPRILELSPVMPNVIPSGEGAFDFYHQQAVEYYVEKFFNLKN